MNKKVAVIGGGAAGFFCAIRIKELNPSLQVILFESTSKTLKKVRISGGGRCNVTHSCFDPRALVQNYPRGSKELLGPFHQFQPKDTVDWFKARGVPLKTEADGRMFPITDNSETIAQCLEEQVRSLGVELRTNSSVDRILREGESFRVQEDQVHAVVLATGSSPIGHRLATELGHSIEKPVPSLFTFNMKDPRLDDLTGTAFAKAKVVLKFQDGSQFTQTGPVLITHWGLSGPAVLKLSAFAARPLFESNYCAELSLNLLPDSKEDEVFQQLVGFKVNKSLISNSKPFAEIPRRYWERLLAFCEIDEKLIWPEVSNKKLQILAKEMVSGQFQVAGKGVFKDEFVTCGGVSLKEIHFKTMESKIVPNLYFAGEVLDIDGITGGFNFQNAWTSAYLAGTACANRNISIT